MEVKIYGELAKMIQDRPHEEWPRMIEAFCEATGRIEEFRNADVISVKFVKN